MGTHWRIETRTQTIVRHTTKWLAQRRMRRNCTIGKMRYWKRILQGGSVRYLIARVRRHCHVDLVGDKIGRSIHGIFDRRHGERVEEFESVEEFEPAEQPR